MNIYNFLGVAFAVYLEHENDGIYAVAECPICDEWSEESHDHGFGKNHALHITLGKMKTHVRLTHKLN